MKRTTSEVMEDPNIAQSNTGSSIRAGSMIQNPSNNINQSSSARAGSAVQLNTTNNNPNNTNSTKQNSKKADEEKNRDSLLKFRRLNFIGKIY